jgi:hypothetical protein
VCTQNFQPVKVAMFTVVSKETYYITDNEDRLTDLKIKDLLLVFDVSIKKLSFFFAFQTVTLKKQIFSSLVTCRKLMN